MAEFYAALKSLWVVWLMGVFLAIAVWAYWPRNKERLQAHARIPLDDEPTPSVRLNPSSSPGPKA
jgi:cytochrome c oxidase cbb3-type subunit 4